MAQSIDIHSGFEKKIAAINELRDQENLSAFYNCHMAGPLHDLNNLLQVITGYAEILKYTLPVSSKEQQISETLLAASLKAADYIRHLMKQFNNHELECALVNVNSLVNETVLLTENLLPPEIALKRQLCPEAGAVNAHPLLLQNSVINLILNARDAMPKGGFLTLSTAVRHADDQYVKRFPFSRKGAYSTIRIQDTGCGMTDEQMKNLFLPFHSTKGAPGRGMGLFNVLHIAKRLDGHVTVESRPGKGACFEICLPRHDYQRS